MLNPLSYLKGKTPETSDSTVKAVTAPIEEDKQLKNDDIDKKKKKRTKMTRKYVKWICLKMSLVLQSRFLLPWTKNLEVEALKNKKIHRPKV